MTDSGSSATNTPLTSEQTHLTQMPSDKAARLWLAVLLLGLGFEALALAFFTPATFMLFAVVGVPLCAVAAGFFATRAIRAFMKTGIL